MTDTEIKEAVEWYEKKMKLCGVGQTEATKNIETLLNLANRYLSVKMPEKKELARKIMYHKAQATLSETQCEVIANEFIDECRLFYADKLLGLEEVIEKVEIECFGYFPIEKIANAIRRMFE